MTQHTAPVHTPCPPETLHSGFLALLPRLEAHARVAFRHLQCPGRHEDAVAETIAVAWRWYVRAAQRGKDVAAFAATFARYAARAVRCGRRVCGQEKAKDVLSSRAQQGKGFAVASLPTTTIPAGGVFELALCDNTQTPVPDQVQFRSDFPAWCRTRSDRDRRLIDDLMLGARTRDVADKFGMSAGRVSQLRGEFHQDWERFCDGRGQGGERLT